MKKLLIIGSIVFVCMILAVSPVILDSQTKTMAQPQLKKLDAKLVQLATKTDLRVDVVHSTRCACELPGVDAFYMGNILVDVSNYKVDNVGVATESILKVVYFDLLKGERVVIQKNLPVMNTYPTNPWAMQRIMVVDHPVLIKKSEQLIVRIKPKNPNITDPVQNNSVKKIDRCQGMVY